MAVTDEQFDALRERVHEVETRSRGQMDLTAYVLGRLGSIDESLVAHTKLLVELSQRQNGMEQRQERMEERMERMEGRQDHMDVSLTELHTKIDALPKALAALIKPSND